MESETYQLIDAEALEQAESSTINYLKKVISCEKELNEENTRISF